MLVMAAIAILMIAGACRGGFLVSGFGRSCGVACLLERLNKLGVGCLLVIESDCDELVGKRCGDFLHTLFKSEITLDFVLAILTSHSGVDRERGCNGFGACAENAEGCNEKDD